MRASRLLIYVLPYLVDTDATPVLIVAGDAQYRNARNEDEDEEHMLA